MAMAHLTAMIKVRDLLFNKVKIHIHYKHVSIITMDLMSPQMVKTSFAFSVHVLTSVL